MPFSIGYDAINDQLDPIGTDTDPHGHGTHLTSVILSSHATAGGKYNGVAPGAILWPENFFEDEDRLAILARIPLGRPGTPQDIADTVRFLVEADYMTGQILAVDGGRSVQQ